MIKVNIDASAIVNVGTDLERDLKKVMKDAGQKIMAMTYAHIVEEAGKKLHSRREMYIKGIKTSQVGEDTFLIHLDASVMWIEEGMEAHNMVEDLLSGKGTKTAKDGSKYAVIPFKHNKGPTQQTPAQTSLTDTIKSELKKKGIGYSKIEKDSMGKPKLGLLHSLDIRTPAKTAEGPGQGKGPMGQPKQGPTGIPFLHGVRVYQREVAGPGGQKTVKRDIMTFRVVSSKHKNQGRWDHPGLDAVKIFDGAIDWAKKTWEEKIVPEISKKLNEA